ARASRRARAAGAYPRPAPRARLACAGAWSCPRPSARARPRSRPRRARARPRPARARGRSASRARAPRAPARSRDPPPRRGLEQAHVRGIEAQADSVAPRRGLVGWDAHDQAAERGVDVQAARGAEVLVDRDAAAEWARRVERDELRPDAEHDLARRER